MYWVFYSSYESASEHGSSHRSKKHNERAQSRYCWAICNWSEAKWRSRALRNNSADIIRKSNAAGVRNEVEFWGRKPKSTVRSIRLLLSYVRKNRFKSIQFITAKYNECREEYGSVNTVRSVLHKNGIRNYLAATKLFLSTRNFRKRLEWARVHQIWSEEQWDTVIFSYETSVTVGSKKQRKLGWRKQGERYRTYNLVTSFTSGYVGISTWRAFGLLDA